MPRPDCVLEDISEDGSGAIRACLCQRDMCNSRDTEYTSGDTGDSVSSSPVTTLPILAQIVQKPSPQKPPAVNTAAGGGHLQDLQERPRAGAGFRVNLDTGNSLQLEEEELEGGGAGLRCYSCGSLLSPAAADPPCSASNSSWRGEVRSCGPGQACLLYTWARGAHTGEWSCWAYFQFVFGAFL